MASEYERMLWAQGPAHFDAERKTIWFPQMHPDLPTLFTQFNRIFFGGSLDCVSVEWSKRMTLCAGQCQFSRAYCVVKLSEPLLSLRPSEDLVDTLLHEQIHAWLWTKRVFEREDNGHGPRFKAKMREINAKAGTSITPYHDWHAEVESHRGHWWQCSGVCRNKPPYFGLVKRAMNRPPGPGDSWWARHKASCGGEYSKVREPEEFTRKQREKEERKRRRARGRSGALPKGQKTLTWENKLPATPDVTGSLGAGTVASRGRVQVDPIVDVTQSPGRRLSIKDLFRSVDSRNASLASSASSSSASSASAEDTLVWESLPDGDVIVIDGDEHGWGSEGSDSGSDSDVIVIKEAEERDERGEAELVKGAAAVAEGTNAPSKRSKPAAAASAPQPVASARRAAAQAALARAQARARAEEAALEID